MNQEFLEPRLVGARFDEHSLPLEILKDFAALEEMVIEVAKRQYLSANPLRSRAPKGFTKGLELHLTEIRDGSVRPVIALAFSALLAPAEAKYFAQAKEQIVETISAAEEGRSPTLPQDLLRYFDRFGRGLRKGERMEFSRANGEVSTLTLETRRVLLQASQAEEWTEDRTMKGRIPEMDQADHSFELELRNGAKLKAPLLEPHLRTVLEAFNDYRKGALVAIQGVVRYDRSNRPKSFESIERIAALDPLDIETRLDEILLLQDGWLDGIGSAPDREALPKLAQAFDERYSPELPLPHLYPTPDGGIQAEWTLGKWEVTLEISLPSMRAEFQALELGSNRCDELEVDLSDEDGSGWERLNVKLREMVGVDA